MLKCQKFVYLHSKYSPDKSAAHCKEISSGNWRKKQQQQQKAVGLIIRPTFYRHPL